MHDARTPHANENFPDDSQETLQTLRPDGTLGESEEDMEARLAMESLMRHRRARRRKKLIVGGIVGVIVLAGAVAWGISRFTGNAGGGDSPQLMTTFVDRGDFTEAVETSGAVKPVTSVVVNPEVGGTIESVNVAEGDTVQEGDVLLTVKNDELDKEIRDAEMGVRNAKLGVSQAQSAYATTLEAYNTVVETPDDRGSVEYKHGAEASAVDSAAFAVESAKNSLSDAQEAYSIAVANAEKRTVRAPKSGSVVAMNAQIGASTDSAANAGGLIQIADLSQMTANVQIMLQSVPDTLMVPLSCVAMDEAGGSYVMVVTDYETGAAERRSVSVRASNQTTAAIEGDVDEGDKVLLDPYSVPDPDMGTNDGSGPVSTDGEAPVAENAAGSASDDGAEPTAAADTAA